MQTASAVSPEVVAAITAALTVVIDRPFAIKSIRPDQPAGALSAWAQAGRLQQQLTRAGFGKRL